MIKNEYIFSYNLPQNDLISKLEEDRKGKQFIKVWNLNPPYINEIKETIVHNSSCKLSKICDNYRGIRTGSKDVFVINKRSIDDLRLEKELLKRVIIGTSVNKWSINYEDLYLLYLNKDIDLNMENYPNTFNYLSKPSNKDTLENRAQYKSRKDRGEDINWYNIEQPLNPTLFENPKILTQRISSKYGFTIDYDNYYVIETCSTIVPKEKYKKYITFILGILNSKMMQFYCKNHFKSLGKDGYEFEPQFLVDIPIKFPRNSKEEAFMDNIMDNVQKILEFKKPLDIEDLINEDDIDKLINLNCVKFSLDDGLELKALKTDKNKLYLNENNYIQVDNPLVLEFLFLYLSINFEKFKKTETLTDDIFNINIPKLDRIRSIIKIINDKETVDEKIIQIEEEINKCVYKLYGLDKEIAIIDNDLN